MRWIKTSDILPEMAEHIKETSGNGFRCSSYDQSARCLIVVNGNVTDSHYVKWGATGKFHWRMIADEVTHWMPYPEPPK